MRLIIFKPAYYSKYHSVDDLMPVLYKLCEFVNEKNYSSIIDKIMIGPIIAPQDEIKTGKWFEVVKCWKNQGMQVFLNKLIIIYLLTHHSTRRFDY